jgi:carbon-monoxide dehydrogenase large subunit
MAVFELAKEVARRGADLTTHTQVEVANTFPNGCHIAEVEIDPETGATRLADYVAVDDCGVVLDHTLAEAQVVGGVAQGIGQALMEAIVYDASGQLIGGTLLDYAMPRADTLPPIRAEFHPVRCTTNALGAKGVGEAGTTAALAAVMNAIADAVPDGRGAAIDMPATAEKVWRAFNAG